MHAVGMTLKYGGFVLIDGRKILELHFDGVSQRTISASTGHSRNTVSDVIQRATERGIDSLEDRMTKKWLYEFLFPEREPMEKGYHPVDFEMIHKELQKKNVTLKLLHHEYCSTARDAGKIPYAYRSFTEKYGSYAKKYKLTMPIRRKPGEVLEVDWAGTTLKIMDSAAGEEIEAYIFVAALPYSQYFYAETFLDMKSRSWLLAHVHAFEYFGGVTETLVPDNLKTGITKHRRGDSQVNEAYRELADHYRTVVVPSRIRKPKDKSSVEGAVGFLSRQIIAALRNYQCFHIEDLNKEIHSRLEEMNTQEFQKRSGSRKSVFTEEESATLRPLPKTRFKMTEWRTAKVQLNYHIQVERMFYSVPYDYTREDVDVRLTASLIEVYFKDVRIASHTRLKGAIGQYATNTDHMPDNHRLYLDHNPENNRAWARTVGTNMEKFVTYILENNVEKKALGFLSVIRNLNKKHTNDQMEAAAKSLLEVASQPTISVYKGILDRQKKKAARASAVIEQPSRSKEDHGFTRGAKYFGGDRT